MSALFASPVAQPVLNYHPRRSADIDVFGDDDLRSDLAQVVNSDAEVSQHVDTEDADEYDFADKPIPDRLLLRAEPSKQPTEPVYTGNADDEETDDRRIPHPHLMSAPTLTLLVISLVSLALLLVPCTDFDGGRTRAAKPSATAGDLEHLGVEPDTGRWTAARANAWYASHRTHIVGSNSVPSTASNQLEMFQPETFNLSQIDRELSYAQNLGMTTMRVFLHDLLYRDDPRGFLDRLDSFLAVCEGRGIRPLLVFFDSCWDPKPVSGPQRDVVPGVHNSRWLQSPGVDALDRWKSESRRLKAYVQGVVRRFAKDDRVLGWDMWNEPDQGIGHRFRIVADRLPEVFRWAREMNPTQPLTSGPWWGNWTNMASLHEMARIQISNSDILSFHDYSGRPEFEEHVRQIKHHGRPVICTEWLARGQGNTVKAIMPMALDVYDIGMINWGFVAGRTQTIFPWDSWQRPYEREPKLWHHDLIRNDGRPFSKCEAAIFRKHLVQA
ncbi:hypothetical protein HK101_010329 [Irineochytrium annulatum]|nr:hypothetical protein HK101_010329 [Irineochytrium annulatum]